MATEFGESSIPSFSKESERQKILDLLATPPRQKLQIDFLGSADPQNKKFLLLFAKGFWPIFQTLRELEATANAIEIALDRALYLNVDEQKKWTQKSLTIKKDMVSILSSREYQNLITNLAVAAMGLAGELPDFIRNLYSDLSSTGVRSHERQQWNRIDQLLAEISAIAAKSPVAGNLGIHEQSAKSLQRDFNSGALSFEDAKEQLKTLAPMSPTALGQYIATQAKNQLDEVARIRSQLAKSKGFSSWTNYVLYSTRGYYAPELASPKNRIDLLHQFLQSTYSMQLEVYQFAVKSHNQTARPIAHPIHSLNAAEVNLLLPPTESLIEEFLPLERVNEVWRETMLESGFGPNVVNAINFDSFSREGKNSHAYMLAVHTNEPRTFIVDAKTLNVKIPRQVPKAYLSKELFVVQNIRTDGPKGYKLAFHEGGHAVDFAHRQDPLRYGQESAYTETQAIFMESFLHDREFLTAVGKNREGHKISPEKVDEYLENLQASELHRVRLQALYSLFDLILWNIDFEKSKTDFVTTAIQLYYELWDKYMIPTGSKDSLGIKHYYSPFSTDHFYNGSVSYIGYFFAEMAAHFTHERLTQRFAKQFGRGSLFKQPRLARILSQAFYKSSFKLEFPIAIENFSGQKFDANTYANHLVNTTSRWLYKKTQICKFLF